MANLRELKELKYDNKHFLCRSNFNHRSARSTQLLSIILIDRPPTQFAQSLINKLMTILRAKSSSPNFSQHAHVRSFPVNAQRAIYFRARYSIKFPKMHGKYRIEFQIGETAEREGTRYAPLRPRIRFRLFNAAKSSTRKSPRPRHKGA